MSSSLSPSRDRYEFFHLVDQESGKTNQDPESTPSVPNQVLLTNLFSVSKTSSLEPTPTENRPSSVFASTDPTVQQMYKPTLLSHATPSEKVYVPTEKAEEPDREPATPTVSQMYQPTLLSHPSVITSISTSETPFPPTQASENLEFASVSPTDTNEEKDLDSLSSADDSEDADLDSSSSPTVSQMWESTVFVRSNPSNSPLSDEDNEEEVTTDRMLELEKFSKRQTQKKGKKQLKKKRLVAHSAPSFTPSRLPRNQTNAGIPSADQVRGAFSTQQRSSVAVYWGSRYTHPMVWKRKLKSMSCLMNVNVTYSRLPDNHTLVVLTAGGYVLVCVSL